MDGPNSISPGGLFEWLGTASAPLVLDVRRAAAFDADSQMLASAARVVPDDVSEWARHIPSGKSVVVYCVYGHEVSQGVATTLREAGIEARYLVGGITAWAERGLPLRTKTEIRVPPAGGDRAP